MGDKVGTQEVVHRTTLILPPRVDSWIEFDLSGWRFRLHIVFEASSLPERKPVYQLKAMGDYGEMTLTDWENPIGLVTTNPVDVATTSDGRKLFMMLWHAQLGEVRKLDAEFLMEAKA